MSTALPDELVFHILSFYHSGMEVKSPNLKLCLVSHQFLRCFLPLAYHTIILDGKTSIKNFRRLLDSPETAYSFRRSCVVRMAINSVTWPYQWRASREILSILNHLPSIKELYVYCWNDDMAHVLNNLSPQIRLLRLNTAVPMGCLTALVSRDPLSCLTHLEIFEPNNGPLPQLDVPTLTHLVVRTLRSINPMHGLMEAVRRINECTPPSLRILGVVFNASCLNRLHPFDEFAQTVLEMTKPFVILGSHEAVSELVDEKIISTFFINGTRHLSWGPDAGSHPPPLISWTREDIWDVIERMLANRRK